MKKLLTIIFAVISLQAMATPEDSNDLLNDNSTAAPSNTATGTGKSSQPKLIIVKSSANPQAENRPVAKPKHVSKSQHKEVHKKHKTNKKAEASTKKGKKSKTQKEHKKKSAHKQKSTTKS